MADWLKWGILATGGIARQFAGGLKVSKTGELAAVGSRTLESAEGFCEKYGGKPYGSYDEVLADPEVQAVYIALPHHMHYDWTIKTAQAGKGILCEKPFTLNALEARGALDEVAKHGVFFMEAFMYRCIEQTQKARQLVLDGAIGELQAINAEFSFGAGKSWENFRTQGDLGGGGLMDVGSYCVSFARYLTGEEPDVACYLPKLSERGYDEWGSGAMRFPGGVTCHFAAGVHCNMRNHVLIYGTGGWIEIEAPWKAYKGNKMILHAHDKEPETFDLGITNDELYAAEADAVAEYFEAGECPHMTPADTLGQMRALDMLRESAGMKFAAELKA
jgi:predicted dehydrogenase